MTKLNPEDQALLVEALAAQVVMANREPVNTGWQHRWIGTGNDSGKGPVRWQCQGLRTVIFTKPGDNAGPDHEYRWVLTYTHEKGFGAPIDQHAPAVSRQFHDIIAVPD